MYMFDPKLGQEERDKRIKSREESRLKAKQEVDSLVRKMRFESYIASGITPQQAAMRMGVKISPYEHLTPHEILKRVEEGK
jgi:hypothetical protein